MSVTASPIPMQRAARAMRSVPQAGTHSVSWGALVDQFGTSSHRLGMLGELHPALLDLRAAGVRDAFVAGSFVTSKQLPRDLDVMFRAARGADPVGVADAIRRASGGGRTSLWDMADEISSPGSLFRYETVDELFRRGRHGGEVGVAHLLLDDLPLSAGSVVDAATGAAHTSESKLQMVRARIAEAMLSTNLA